MQFMSPFLGCSFTVIMWFLLAGCWQRWAKRENRNIPIIFSLSSYWVLSHTDGDNAHIQCCFYQQFQRYWKCMLGKECGANHEFISTLWCLWCCKCVVVYVCVFELHSYTLGSQNIKPPLYLLHLFCHGHWLVCGCNTNSQLDYKLFFSL